MPWCVPCGNIMVLPHVITLAVQQVYKRECLLHAHCHAVGACIHTAIGIENRPIEAGVTENRRSSGIYNSCAYTEETEGKPTLTVSTDLALSHVGLLEIADVIITDSMRIEARAAEVPWCVSCGIMVLPRVITLAVQPVYKRECLLQAHCHAVGACIDYAIGIEKRSIEAGVTENRRPGGIYNNCCADIRKRQWVNLP